MGKALDLIAKLDVKTFTWKHSEEPDIGLIAEEVVKVIPEAGWYVNGRLEGLKPLTLIAVLIEAIKEIQYDKAISKSPS